MVEFLCCYGLEFLRMIIRFKGKVVVLCLISRIKEDFD